MDKNQEKKLNDGLKQIADFKAQLQGLPGEMQKIAAQIQEKVAVDSITVMKINQKDVKITLTKQGAIVINFQTLEEGKNFKKWLLNNNKLKT